MKSAIIRALIRLDRWVNDKLLKGRYETISGRCYRRSMHDCRFCTWLCGQLHKIDPGHCRRAFFEDRAKNPKLPWV